jgi:hypothetical protein
LQEEAVEIENSGQKEIEDMDLMPRHSSETTEDIFAVQHSYSDKHEGKDWMYLDIRCTLYCILFD